MSTYATAQDVVNYISGYVVTDPFDTERLIQAAETDIDRIILSLSRELPPTQVIVIENATGGTFKVAWNGANPASTPNEAFNVSALALEVDLQAIADIGADDVVVVGSNPWTLVWSLTWAKLYTGFAIPAVTVDGSLLTPGDAKPTVMVVQGRKLDPIADLTANQALALSRATCAQVEYRNAMGDSFFVRAQYDSVAGPDFTTKGKLPYLGPKVLRELTECGFLFNQGRAVASYSRRGVASGWPTY